MKRNSWLKNTLFLAIIALFVCGAQIVSASGINEDEEAVKVIIAASYRGYTDIVKSLLAKGVNVNSQDVNYNSALSAASERSHKELVKFILSKGADKKQIKPFDDSSNPPTEAPDDYDMMMIMTFGARWGMIDVVKTMADKGVSVNAADRGGNPAIAIAAAGNYTDIVRYLLAKGADINLLNGYLTPLDYALSQGGADGAEILVLNGAKLSNPDNRWYEKKLYAIMMKKDKDLEARDPDTELNLMMMAAKQNHVGTVKYLLAKGADINSAFKSSRMRNRQQNGSTPLIYALQESRGLDVARELIKRKAKLNVLNNSDETPLLISVYYADLEMVKLLLDNGADVNKGDSFGHTPYYYAMMNNHAEMMQLLKSRGGR